MVLFVLLLGFVFMFDFRCGFELIVTHFVCLCIGLRKLLLVLGCVVFWVLVVVFDVAIAKYILQFMCCYVLLTLWL